MTAHAKFPSPYDLKTPVGAEGWEKLYPYYLQFQNSLRDKEDGKSWFCDSQHWPSPYKPFDAVILSDCSQCPVHPQLKRIFHEYAKKHSDTVVKHGARPVFLMTWAYKDKPEMTAQLAEEYTVAGNANDALVIPAGLAFAKAISKRPDLEFYQPDKRHPTLIGTYLAAATAYASIYKKSPVGNSYSGGIDAKTANFLQSVAWETVQEYFGKSQDVKLGAGTK